MCLGQFCCFPFSICSTPVLALHDCDVADAEGRVNVLEYGEMWKSSFQCWDSRWGGILLQWPVALEVLLVSVNGSVACVKWKKSQLSQLLAIVSSHGQLTERIICSSGCFLQFFVVHTTMRFSYFETHRAKLECMQLWIYFVAVWWSGNVGPSLQTGSSLHQQSLLFRPPPFCHLSDNKLILCYRWKELTFFSQFAFP